MSYNRKKTREVSLGNIKIGGDNPIAVQSMTTTDTRDAAKTIEQIKKLYSFWQIKKSPDFTDYILLYNL